MPHSSARPPSILSKQLTLWRLPSAAEPGQQQPPALQLSSTPIPGGDVQTWVRFSPDDPAELVTNGARRVYFWRAPRGGGEPASQQTPAVAGTAAAVGAAGGGGSSGGGAPVSYYSPPLVAADFRQAVGNFMASVFVPGTSQVRGCAGACVTLCLSGTEKEWAGLHQSLGEGLGQTL